MIILIPQPGTHTHDRSLSPITSYPDAMRILHSPHQVSDVSQFHERGPRRSERELTIDGRPRPRPPRPGQGQAEIQVKSMNRSSSSKERLKKSQPMRPPRSHPLCLSSLEYQPTESRQCSQSVHHFGSVNVLPRVVVCYCVLHPPS